MARSGINSSESMSSTAGERLRDREKQRQARAQLAVEPESFTPLFSAPIKVAPAPGQDATRKMIEETLGSFDLLKHSIVDDQKVLIGVWQQPQTPLPAKQHHDPEEDEEVGPRGFSSSMGGAKPEFAAPKKPSYRNAPLPPRFPSTSSSTSQRSNPAPPPSSRARTVPPLAPPSSVPYHSSGGGYPAGSGREKDSNSGGGGGASGGHAPLGGGLPSNHASYHERNHNLAVNKRNSVSNGTGPPRPPNVTKNRVGGAYSSSMPNGGEDVELILKEMQVAKLLPEIAATPRNEFDPSRCEFSKMLNNSHHSMAPPANPVGDNGPSRPGGGAGGGGPGIVSFANSLKRLDCLVQNDLNISDSEDNNSDVEAPPPAPPVVAGTGRSTDLPDPRSSLMRSPIASPMSPLAPETPCPPVRKSESPLYPSTKRLSTSSDEGENSDDGSSSNSPSASGTDSSSEEEPEEDDNEEGKAEREDKTVTKDGDKTSQPPPESPPASVSSWRLTDFLQPPNPPQVDLNTSLSFDEPPTKINQNNMADDDDDQEAEVVPKLSKELDDALGNITIVPPMLSPFGFSDSDDSATNGKDEEPPKTVKPAKPAPPPKEVEEPEEAQRPPRPSSVASTHSTSSQHRRHLASPAFSGKGGKKVPDPAPVPPSPPREDSVITPKKKRGRPPKNATAARGPVTSTPAGALTSPAHKRQPIPQEFLSSPSSSSSSSPSSSSSSSSSSSESSSEDEGGGGRRRKAKEDTTTSDVDVTGTPSPAKTRLASPVAAQPPPPPPRAPSSLASRSPVISELSSSSSASSSEDEAPPPVMSKGKKSPPKLDHGGKTVQDKMKSKAIMRLIGPRGRSSNSISSTSSPSETKKLKSTESPLRATSNERPLTEVNETIRTPPPPVDGVASGPDTKPSLMCRLRLNMLLRRPGEKKALAETEYGPGGGANAPTPPPDEKTGGKKRHRRPSSSSVSSSASGRRSKHHTGGEKENREQKGAEPVMNSNNSSNNSSSSSKSSSKRSVMEGKTPEQRKEKRKRRNSDAEVEVPVAPPPPAKKALVMDEPAKVKEKAGKAKGNAKEPKRIRTKEAKGGGASERSSPLNLFTNHERNGDVAEEKKAELMNGHGNKVKAEIKADTMEGAGPDHSSVSSERKENAASSGTLVGPASTSTSVPVYYSYFETPRPLPGSDDIDLDVRDQNQYLVEAKKLKHAADRQSNRTLQVKQYLEAVLYFILTGIAMEHDPAMEKSAHILYKDTLGLIKTISSSQKALQQVDSKLVVLSLRCQSLLYLKLYRIRHLEAKELQRIINDYQKKINDDAKREQPGTHPYSNAPAAVPVPTSVVPGTATSTGLFRSTGTPSPLSPTPSPAGSVGSVGSQSSGYSSGELPPGGSSGGATASASVPAATSSSGGAAAALANPAMPGVGGGAKPDPAQVNNGALNGCVSVPVAVHNILLKQNQYFVYLNSCHDLWEQGDVLVHQAELQDFFVELDRICGPLTLHSSLRDLVRYARQGLQRLRYSAASNSSR